MGMTGMTLRRMDAEKHPDVAANWLETLGQVNPDPLLWTSNLQSPVELVQAATKSRVYLELHVDAKSLVLAMKATWVVRDRVFRLEATPPIPMTLRGAKVVLLAYVLTTQRGCDWSEALAIVAKHSPCEAMKN